MNHIVVYTSSTFYCSYSVDLFAWRQYIFNSEFSWWLQANWLQMAVDFFNQLNLLKNPILKLWLELNNKIKAAVT